jgi:serine/threonine-protein kinase
MKTVIYITLAIGLGLQIFYFSEYPETVANHFGSGGMPNGWMSNTTNLLISMAVVFINSSIFLATPYIFKNVPFKYISFPKKGYWLAPERKESSITLISKYMYILVFITNLFLISVFHLVYMANQNHPPKLNESIFLVLMSVYIVILVAWLIALFAKFSKTNLHQ